MYETWRAEYEANESCDGDRGPHHERFGTESTERVDPDRPARTTRVVQAIEQAGGHVTYRFKHVNGIAAEVPDSALLQIERLVGADNIGRDELIPLPEVADPRGGPVAGEAEADDVVMLDGPGVSVDPANYAFNATLTNVAPLHAAGRSEPVS